MVGQKYFNRSKRAFGGQKFIKYNKINNNSESFRGARLLPGVGGASPFVPLSCGSGPYLPLYYTTAQMKCAWMNIAHCSFTPLKYFFYTPKKLISTIQFKKQ